MKRPIVTTRCVAQTYASTDERIIEFTFADGLGGLISFRQGAGARRPVVELYRVDRGIRVIGHTRSRKMRRIA